MYGPDESNIKDFGHQSLLARRFVERGVRFEQVTYNDAFVQ